MTEQNQIVRVVSETGLEPATSGDLIAAFTPLFDEANAAVRESATLTVTDATQVSAMKAARAARLKLRDVRIRVENTRKAMKEDSLRKGKAIDGIANVLKFLIEPEEKRLEDAEKFAERAEAERLRARAESRRTLIGPFVTDPGAYAVADMTDAAFDEFLATLKLAHAAKLEAEAKAAAEREAAAQREREERARLEEERRRMAAELEASNRARAAEQAAAAEALRVEREKAEAARREAEALRVAEERKAAEALRVERERKAAEERAAAAAAAAPDVAKIEAFAAAILAVTLAPCATDAGKAVAANVEAKAKSFAAWIAEQAKTLK